MRLVLFYSVNFSLFLKRQSMSPKDKLLWVPIIAEDTPVAKVRNSPHEKWCLLISLPQQGKETKIMKPEFAFLKAMQA